jgi:hypothetical protein
MPEKYMIMKKIRRIYRRREKRPSKMHLRMILIIIKRMDI